MPWPDNGRGRARSRPGPADYTATNGTTDNGGAVIVPDAGDGVAECRGCGEITELIQGSDWCWACVYDDPPYVDYAGRPTLGGAYAGGDSHD